MSGTIKGGKRAAQTNKRRYGKDFFAVLGRAGGSVKGSKLSSPKGFAANRQLASEAGRKGGMNGRRKPQIKEEVLS